MRLLVVLSIAVLASTPDAAASDDTWRTRQHGTGGWNGLREARVEDGFVLGGFYVFDALGNPSGGLERSTAYAGHFELDLSLNLDRLLDLDGLGFDLAMSWSSGANLSDDIGNVFQVGEAYSGRTVQLTRLYVEQTMARGRLFLKLGRISAGNDFAVLPANVYHVSAGINGNPLSLSLNEPGFFTDPVAQWGLRLLVRPNDRLRFRVAAYNPDPTVGEEGRNGLDFSFDPSGGVLVMTEVAYRLEIEVNHSVQATPWLYLTPDLQVVLDPGGTDIPTALVLGIEVGVTF